MLVEAPGVFQVFKQDELIKFETAVAKYEVRSSEGPPVEESQDEA